MQDHHAVGHTNSSKLLANASSANIANNTENAMNSDALVERIRGCRDDAMSQRLYPTASFWGDKVLTMTMDMSDAYQLAQIYTHDGEYVRAERLLRDHGVAATSLWGKYLSAYCAIKTEQPDRAIAILGDEDRCRPSDAALDVRLSNTHGRSLRIEASVLYLRGIAFIHLGIRERAKANFVNALQIDVRCFQAFDALLENHLLSLGEERMVLNSLNLKDLSSHDSEFIRLIYQSRASHNLTSKQENELQSLESVYKLTDNSDVLIAKARQQCLQCNFEEALQLTTKILSKDPYNVVSLPIHISCLYETKKKNILFVFAHELVDLFPRSYVSWYAVAMYYLLISKYHEARRYFSKSTLMAPDFGLGWIGFALSFSLDGEHDQAVSAYSTAIKICPGWHIPRLYLGMEYLHMNNLALADEYFHAAYDLCDVDPLLLNELGALYIQKQDYHKAIQYLDQLVSFASNQPANHSTTDKKHKPFTNDRLTQIQHKSPVYLETALCNLGHAYRHLNDYATARRFFYRVLDVNACHGPTFSALGYMAHCERNVDNAIDFYHKALSFNPDDQISNELLKKAFDEMTLTNMVVGLKDPVLMMDDRLIEQEIEKRLNRQLGDAFDSGFGKGFGYDGNLDVSLFPVDSISVEGHAAVAAEAYEIAIPSEKKPDSATRQSARRNSSVIAFNSNLEGDDGEDELTKPTTRSMLLKKQIEHSGKRGSRLLGSSSPSYADLNNSMQLEALGRQSDVMGDSTGSALKRGLIDFTKLISDDDGDLNIRRSSAVHSHARIETTPSPPPASNSMNSLRRNRQNQMYRQLDGDSSPTRQEEHEEGVWVVSSRFGSERESNLFHVEGEEDVEMDLEDDDFDE